MSQPDHAGSCDAQPSAVPRSPVAACVSCTVRLSFQWALRPSSRGLSHRSSPDCSSAVAVPGAVAPAVSSARSLQRLAECDQACLSLLVAPVPVCEGPISRPTVSLPGSFLGFWNGLPRQNQLHEIALPITDRLLWPAQRRPQRRTRRTYLMGCRSPCWITGSRQSMRAARTC